MKALACSHRQIRLDSRGMVRHLCLMLLGAVVCICAKKVSVLAFCDPAWSNSNGLVLVLQQETVDNDCSDESPNMCVCMYVVCMSA